MPDYLEPKNDDLPMRPSGSWAEEKLDYLKRYIDVFETSMRHRWKIRNYIDLMAGPGKNWVEDSKTVLLGSPLLALTTPHPFTGYFFAEYVEKNFQALQQRCSTSPSPIQIYQGDCNQIVDTIVKKIKKHDNDSLNLAFLDPEGFEMQWNTVAKLASVKRMDLIINYPQGGLNRFMPQVIDAPGENQIDLFFGNKEWRKIYKDKLQSQGAGLHRDLIDFYKKQLDALGYKDVKRDDEIGDEPLMRNAKKNAPLYRLLFASKNDLGNNFWRKITKRNVHGQGRLFN